MVETLHLVGEIMKVNDLMSAPVYVASPEDTVGHVKNLMLRHKISRVMVIYEGTPIGIVTKYDLAQMVESSEAEWRRRNQERTLAKSIMSESLVTITPDASMRRAAQEMTSNGIGSLPVMKNGDLLGILSETDIVSHFAQTNSKMKVETLMSDKFLTCHRHHSINHVLRAMDESGIYRTIVQEGNGVPVGIITHTNLSFAKEPFVDSKDIVMVRKAEHAGEQKNRYVKKVLQVAEDIMTEPLVTISRDATVVEAAQLMIKKRIDCLPIVEDGVLTGIVSKTDIVKIVAGAE
jgi:CBS domain-containing protein